MSLDRSTFDGVTVVDLTQLLPGPFCTMLLADLGARVVKVEPVRGGDWARYTPPVVEDGPDGYGAFFEALHRGKESVALDLKSERGRRALEALVSRADVLIEGFRPGVLARLGFDVAEVRARHPELIVAQISGYGQQGDRAARAGHDLNYLAVAGVLGQTGPAGAPPAPFAAQVADLAGGALYAAFAIAAALFRRERSGQGAAIDIAMAEGALALMAPAFRIHARSGEVPERGADLLTGGVPSYGVYETADGRHLAVGALEPPFWAAVCQVLGCPEHAASGLWTGAEGAAVREDVASRIRARTAAAWEQAFAGVDACVDVVRRVDEVLQDAALRARAAIRDLDGAAWVAQPVAADGPSPSPAPRQGQHTRAVLEELGWSVDEVEEALRAGDVGVASR